MNFKITLTQGLNRQIRRMCEFLGYEVRKLKRVRIMHIELDQPPGQFRDLTEDELDKLKKLVAKSKNTVKAASTPPKKKSAHNKSFSRRKTVAKIPARKKKSRRR